MGHDEYFIRIPACSRQQAIEAIKHEILASFERWLKENWNEFREDDSNSYLAWVTEQRPGVPLPEISLEDLPLGQFVANNVAVEDDGSEEPWFNLKATGWDLDFDSLRYAGNFLSATDIVFPGTVYDEEEEAMDELREEDDSFISVVKIQTEDGWFWLAGGNYPS